MHVSVIIPVYNTAKYLRRCVDSILSQSYKELQIILVDDCSTDGSADICDDYEKSNERVVVIHQEVRGGVSKARNAALGCITGEYVVFVDSDDYCLPNMIEELVRCTNDGSVDIAVCKTIIRGADGKDKISRLPSLKPGLYSHEEIMRALYYCELGNGLVDKIFRTSLIGDSLFPEKIIRAEDTWFAVDLYEKASSLAVSDGAYYVYYRYRQGNSSTSKQIAQHIGSLLYDEKIFDLSAVSYPEYKHLAAELMLKDLISFYLNWPRQPKDEGQRMDFRRIRAKTVDAVRLVQLSWKFKLGYISAVYFPICIYVFGMIQCLREKD